MSQASGNQWPWRRELLRGECKIEWVFRISRAQAVGITSELERVGGAVQNWLDHTLSA